jgi:cytochrome c oxidase subunit 2
MRAIYRTSAGATAVILAGCTRQSVWSPAGPAAREIERLNGFVTGLFLIVAVVVLGLVVFVASRPRGSLDWHAPVDVGGGHSWVMIGGFAIPAAILAIVFISGLQGMAKFPIEGGMHTPAELRLVGHQWWWEVEYLSAQPNLRVTTANEIHIPVGRPVDIDLTSYDVIHSFWVPELHGKVDLIPTVMNRIRIEADRPGIYRGQCAEYCGEQHAHMILTVIAQPPADYAAWLAHEREDAVSPITEQEERGQMLFLTRPCVTCHAIRGTPAGSHVGPDLTHMGRRLRIAANMLENNPANLAAWATHAQSLKPGAHMPNVTSFNGDELQALVAYLASLK